jgi:hypothetical protein
MGKVSIKDIKEHCFDGQTYSDTGKTVNCLDVFKEEFDKTKNSFDSKIRIADFESASELTSKDLMVDIDTMISALNQLKHNIKNHESYSEE